MGKWIENLIFGHRRAILVLFALITVFMGYNLTHLRVDAGFKKQLPLHHEYMQTFEQYEKEFGGANRLLVAVMAEDGDMFDPDFFSKLENVTNEVFFIPGVNRASVRSIFTPNVRFVEIVEDGFAGGNVIPSDFAPTPEMFQKVRSNIVKSGVVGRLVAEDFDGAMVWADLLEIDPTTGEKIDYQGVAAKLEEIREKYQGNGVSVHIIGFAKIIGDVSDGARSVVWFFGIAFVITALLLYLYSGSIKLSMWPLLCSVVAVIWQLGALNLLGFGIDPMNILTPFLIFAIGVSHGVQMISGWANERLFGGAEAIAEGDDLSKHVGVDADTAARKTFSRLLAPGSIALLSDTIGFLTILFIKIDIIRELAITASVGVALIIFTNMVLLPILLSISDVANFDKYRQRHLNAAGQRDWLWKSLAIFTKPVPSLVVLAIAAALFAAGHWKGKEMQIGDSQAGVPELRPDARYNQDAGVISSRFSLGVDAISIIIEAPAQSCTEDYEAMANIDRFAWHMLNVPGVQQVVTLPWVAKIINSGWNEGNIKWRVLPRNNYVMRQNLQSIETDTGLLNTNCSAMPVMVFTEDHKAETIRRVVNKVKDYRSKYGAGADPLDGQTVGPDGSVPADQLQAGQVNFRLGTGNVGVMAATNEDVAAAQMPMLFWVYGAIVVLCLITFRSIMGTICIVAPLTLVSVLAYALMAMMGIGLKVNTLPVVALGVGIGVDYGIYIYSRLQGFLKQGMTLHEAYYDTLRLTGKPVLFTAITLAVGVGTWLFSALQFQADMGILLAFMFLLNMIGAIVLLPALARWLLPGIKK